MKKLIASLLVSAIACFYAGFVWSQGTSPPQTPTNNYGQPPTSHGGPALIDSDYIIGLGDGLNFSAKFNVVATGSTQATANQLGYQTHFLQEIDTVPTSNGGVALGACFIGTTQVLANNASNTLTVYPMIANNVRTGKQDTFNGGATSVTIATSSSTMFFCTKNGNWFTK